MGVVGGLEQGSLAGLEGFGKEQSSLTNNLHKHQWAPGLLSSSPRIISALELVLGWGRGVAYFLKVNFIEN